MEKKQSERQAFAVLTMCRVLHVMEHDTIASKPAAARWAQEDGATQWTPLIQKCLHWEPDRKDWELDQVLDFVRFTVARVC